MTSAARPPRSAAGPAPRRPALKAAAWLGAGLLLVLAACGTAGPPTRTVAPRPTATSGTSTPASPRTSSSTSPSTAPDVGPRTLIDAAFDDERPGAVTPDSFVSALGGGPRQVAAYDSMTYVRDGKGTSNFVRTHLAARKILGANTSRGDGNVLVVALADQGRDAACVAYDVRFAGDFEFAAGGKLPGLLGVGPGTSPGTPTGGGSTEHGWSGRVMWLGPRVSGTVRDSGQENLAASYLYHPGQAGTFGDDLYWGRGFVDGVWHRVRQCYTLNTVGKADGVLDAWLDEIPVLHLTDVVYRTDPEVHITHLDWSVFRGGDTEDWEAGSGGDVDLDNLLVTVS